MASPEARPPCDLDSQVLVDRAVRAGDWTALGHLMGSGQLADQQKARVIVQVTKFADVQQFSQHVRPFCSSAHLSSAVAELVSAGRWTDVSNLTLCAGHGALEWQVGHLSVSNGLLVTVAGGRWDELGTALQDTSSVSPAQKRWALLQACQRATQLEVIENVLPHCPDEDLDCVLKELVSRGLWWAVGSLLSQRRAISETRRTWVIDTAAREATAWELSDFILPRCTTPQLMSVSKSLVKRRLWWALDILLRKDVHRFSECMLPRFVNEDFDLFMSHLLAEGHLKCGQQLLWFVGAVKHEWKIGGVSIPATLIVLVVEERWKDLAVAVAEHESPAVLTWAVEVMSKRAKKRAFDRIMSCLIPVNQIPSMMNNLVQRGFLEDAAQLLCRLVSGTMDQCGHAASYCRLVVPILGGTEEEHLAKITKNCEGLWSLLKQNAYDLRHVSGLYLKTLDMRETYCCLDAPADLAGTPEPPDQLLVKILFDSAIDIVAASLYDQQNAAFPVPQSVEGQVELTMKKILEVMKSYQENLSHKIQRLCIEFKPTARNDSVSCPVFALSFILEVLKYWNCQDHRSFRPQQFLIYLTTVPILPEIQRNALRIRLKRDAWDVLLLSDLSYVGEQTRRLLFASAVRQYRWGFVKRCADHSLHDDQRSWALEEACKEKLWNVCLGLAEHGLTDEQLTHLHCHIVQNAESIVVRDMYEHETDVVEVRELLTKSEPQGAIIEDTVDVPLEQCAQILDNGGHKKHVMYGLAETETRLRSRMASFKTLESAVEQGDWQVVVFTSRQRPTADSATMALTAAVASEAWPVVMQLLRLGVTPSDPRSFFLDMIRDQRWGVCRVVIDQGLSTQLYQEAIPKLMELNQWTLVGKMMDYDVDDAVRRQVMKCALQRWEGTVVRQCIKGLKQQLSIQEREDVFHTAVIRGVLQAVIPLVEEVDKTGVQHRDLALLHAIIQQQWDIVDLCLRHHADINLRDVRGNTPIQRAAQMGDWQTVTALAKRGGDPCQLDDLGLSVIHRAIQARQWYGVKELVTFCDDLQRPARQKEENRTALEMLIDAGRGDIVVHALSRKTRQWSGVNNRGETALHTCCLSNSYMYIRSLLSLGVSPLSVTHRGHSVLAYAVLSKNYPQKTVAECISHGFSSYQPHITRSMLQTRMSILSPVLLAVMRGLPGVTQMLYESGSCSSKELSQILPHLFNLTDPDLCPTSFLKEAFVKEQFEVCPEQAVIRARNRVCFLSGLPFLQPTDDLVQKSALYLIQASSAPRSLKSTCRLVISRCLRISGAREDDVRQLPIPQGLQNYVIFADLVHPSYGKTADSGNRGFGTGHGEEWFYGDSDEEYLDDDFDEGEEWL